ncbi:MAG TPA: hypothetical protein VF173_14735 [Thermoanaerobaculia bacterium]|nr:hypothetical protein [Thermoanaerobaculia bacterium]
MKRRERKKLEALNKAREIAGHLVRDLNIAAKGFAGAIVEYSQEDVPNWELSFRAKTVGRAFFALVDGVSFALRAAVIEWAPEVERELTPEDKRQLQEKKGPAERIAGLELAFQQFSSLFGISFPFVLEGEGGQAFLGLEKTMNEIDHPKVLADLFGQGIFTCFLPASAWFLARLSQLFQVCNQAIEESDLKVEEYDLPALAVIGDKRLVFTDEDLAGVRDTPFAEMKYAKAGFLGLMEDSSRALEQSLEFARIDTIIGPHGQFGQKNLLRTLFAETDGHIAIAKLVLAAAADFSAEDAENFDERLEEDERLVRVLNLFSRKFDRQKQVLTGSKNWQNFRKAQAILQRMANPRSVADLKLSNEAISALDGAQDWFRSVIGLLYVDEEPKTAAAEEEAANPDEAAAAAE